MRWREVGYASINPLIQYFTQSTSSAHVVQRRDGALKTRTVLVVRMMIEAGALPDPAHETGITPLARAMYRGRAKVVEYLLRHGADPRLKDVKGRSVLKVARDLLHRGPEWQDSHLQPFRFERNASALGYTRWCPRPDLQIPIPGATQQRCAVFVAQIGISAGLEQEAN